MQTTTTLAIETAPNTSAALRVLDASGNAASGQVSRSSIKKLVGSDVLAFAHWIPWHKAVPEPSHSRSRAGYDSNDQALCYAQVADMKLRGFDGVVVTWQGPDETSYKNQATAKLLKACEQQGLKFAISPDQTFIRYAANPDKTQVTLDAFKYVQNTYFPSPAYYKESGQPVMFEFGLETLPIDMNKVLSAFPAVKMIYRNVGGLTRPHSAGAFSWIDAGYAYLVDFYKRTIAGSSAIIFGSIFIGFNDTTANWSPLYNGGTARIIPQNNGQLWLDTIKLFRATGLKRFQVATWNDYEEGTAIEPGIDAGYTPAVSIVGNAIKTGPYPPTVDHFRYFISQDGVGLLELDSPTINPSLLEPGDYQVFVKAEGVSCVQNTMSKPVKYTVPGRFSARALEMKPVEVSVEIESASAIKGVDIYGTDGAMLDSFLYEGSKVLVDTLLVEVPHTAMQLVIKVLDAADKVLFEQTVTIE